MAFSLIFDAFWTVFLVYFACKSGHTAGKDDFVKMSVSYTRELHFEGSGGPESVEKGAQRGSQKSVCF